MSKCLQWPWSFLSQLSGLSLDRPWPFGGGWQFCSWWYLCGPSDTQGRPCRTLCGWRLFFERTAVLVSMEDPVLDELCCPVHSPLNETFQHLALGCGWCHNEDIGRVPTCHKSRWMQMLSGEGFLFLPSCKPHAETNSSYIYFQELQYSFLSFFFFPFGEVYICFIFITCLRCVPRPAAAHKPRTCCWEMQSEQLLLFQCVSHSCFSSVISLFFFFLAFSSFLSQTRTNTVRLAGNWQASTIQRQWFFF